MLQYDDSSGALPSLHHTPLCITFERRARMKNEGSRSASLSLVPILIYVLNGLIDQLQEKRVMIDELTAC